MPEHPIRLDLDDYLPYLVNRVGWITALRFGEDVLAQFGRYIPGDVAGAGSALKQRGATPPPRRLDQHRGFRTLSRIVTWLAHRGLVVRAPSKTSGREIAVALSDRGRRLVDRLIPLGRRYEEIASAGLSKQENVVLRRALRHMYRNLINAEPMAVMLTNWPAVLDGDLIDQPPGHGRFDDDRYGARVLQERADVDVVKVRELQPVDRDHRVCDLQLLAQMYADEATDVAVASEHDRRIRRWHSGKPVDHTAAERVQPGEGRGAAPWHEHRDRARKFELRGRRWIKLATSFASISSVNAKFGAITGILRSGSASSGDTKIVLPETCVVYCAAPITVALICSAGSTSGTPKPVTRARTACAKAAPRSSKCLASRP